MDIHGTDRLAPAGRTASERWRACHLRHDSPGGQCRSMEPPPPAVHPPLGSVSLLEAALRNAAAPAAPPAPAAASVAPAPAPATRAGTCNRAGTCCPAASAASAASHRTLGGCSDRGRPPSTRRPRRPPVLFPLRRNRKFASIRRPTLAEPPRTATILRYGGRDVSPRGTGRDGAAHSPSHAADSRAWSRWHSGSAAVVCVAGRPCH